MKHILLLMVLMVVLYGCHKDSNSTLTNNNVVVDYDLCESQKMLEKEISENPDRKFFIDQLEEKTKTYPGREFTNRGAGLLYVPVAVHVVFQDPNYFSDAEILQQIQELNRNFNKQNEELQNTSVYLAGYQLSKVANCQIEFYITDVIRVTTTVDSFARGSTDIKSSLTGGSDPVNPTTKLNIWVCHVTNSVSWSAFPGTTGLADGIVMDADHFGFRNPLHKARIVAHEVGHWLNLRHIWGDATCGNDYVGDTPVHPGPNKQCPSSTLKSNCTKKPVSMMWMNYMDYVYGQCMYMFTTGQKQRMDAAIDYARSGWFSANKIYPSLVF